MAVYFIREGGSGYIKIGFTQNVRRRFDQVKVYSAHEITLLGREPGDAEREAELHCRFAADRIRGEWFGASPDLLAHIAQLAPVPKPKRKNSSEWGQTGITDDIVAAAVGVTRGQCSRIRRGLCRPGLGTALKIAKATGLKLDDIAALSEAA